MLWFMYICTTKQSSAFFPTGCEPNNRSFPSPVFTRTAEQFNWFFPKKTPFRKPSNTTISSKMFMFQTSASASGCTGVLRERHRWAHCHLLALWGQWTSLERIQGQRTPESDKRAQHCPAQAPSPGTPAGKGWARWSGSLHWVSSGLRSHCPSRIHDSTLSDWEPPAPCEICPAAVDPHSLVPVPCFLLALKTDGMYELSKPGYHCLQTIFLLFPFKSTLYCYFML